MVFPKPAKVERGRELRPEGGREGGRGGQRKGKKRREAGKGERERRRNRMESREPKLGLEYCHSRTNDALRMRQII